MTALLNHFFMFDANGKRAIIIFVVLAIFSSPNVYSRQIHGTELEVRTKAEDEAAEAVFQSSLRGMRILIKQKANSKEEPILLSQYAETLNKMAGIQFRLVHGAGETGENNRYIQTLNEIVQTENLLIKKYSKTKELGRYYFVRARALKELGKDDFAIADFKRMIDQYPDSQNISDAVFSIYDLLSKKKDFKTAIFYLKKIENRRTEPYYPMLVDDMAFAYYYLNDYSNALKYLHYELALSAKEANPAQERVKILKNCALFYFTAMTKNVAGYTTKALFPYLQSLNPGTNFSELLKYLSYLLRAKGRDSDLESLKYEVLYARLPFVDTLEFLFVVFENEINKRLFSHLHETVEIFDKLALQMRNNPQYKVHYDQVYSILGESVQKLQALFVKKEEVQNKSIIENALISVLEALLKSTTESAGQTKIHFNLAEVYFQKKDYASASRHYAWVLQNKDPKNAFLEQSRFKLVTSEYAALSAKQMFPKEVKPVAMDGVQPKAFQPEVQQWMASVGDLFRTKHDDEISVFMLESGRLLYAYGHIPESIAVLNQLIEASPNSTYSVPAALLILNTYLISKKWHEAFASATEFQKKMTLAKPEFKKTLRLALADSNFKMIEALYQQGKYAEVLPQVDSFLKAYSDSERRHDALSLAGNAGLALKDKKRALTYFNAMLKEKGTGKGVAYLTNADDAEQNFRFAEAATHYKTYLELPASERALSPQELAQLKRKDLLLAWLSGDGHLLSSVLKSAEICSSDIGDLCGDLKAYQEMLSPPKIQVLLDHWKHANTTQKAILTPALLRNPLSISIEDRMLVLKSIAANWDASTPLMKYALLPYLSQLIQPALKQSGTEIKKLSPLQLNKQKIQNRTQWIKKMEEALEQLLSLSWARIRASVYHEWANLYSDFADDIRGIPQPKGLAADGMKAYQGTVNDLTAPLLKKATEFRKKALDIAMDKGIESDVFYPMNLSAYREIPSLPKASMMLNFVAQDPFIYLDALRSSTLDPRVLGWINDAVAKKNWLVVSYLSQDQQVKTLVKPEILTLTQALSLVVAGAQAEGIEAVKEILPKLDQRPKILALFSLVHAYYGVRAVANTKIYLEQLNSILTPQDANFWNANESMILAEANEWIKGVNQVAGAAALAPEAQPTSTPEAKPTVEAESVPTPVPAPSPSVTLAPAPVPTATAAPAPTDTGSPDIEALPPAATDAAPAQVPTTKTVAPSPKATESSPAPSPSGEEGGSDIFEATEGG